MVRFGRRVKVDGVVASGLPVTSMVPEKTGEPGQKKPAGIGLLTKLTNEPVPSVFQTSLPA